MSDSKDIFEVVGGEIIIYPDRLKEAYKRGYLYASGVLAMHIRIFNPKLPIQEVDAFCKEYGMSRGTFYKAVKNLQELGEYPTESLRASPEKVVRDRLKTQLGGLAEVTTPVGRIDLLTNTEVIEVKNVKDWKAAMGQVVAYSAYFPNHQKRLHLFYGKTSKPSTELGEAYRICSELGIVITIEQNLDNLEGEDDEP